MKSGWIYFARFGADGPIKIGRGANPHTRRTSLAVGSPVPIVLLGAMRSVNAAAEEAILHEKLDGHRVRGEWFAAEPVLLEMQLLAARLLAPEDILVKDEQLHIQVDSEDALLWKRTAAEAGMTLTAWMRTALNALLPADLREELALEQQEARVDT